MGHTAVCSFFFSFNVIWILQDVLENDDIKLDNMFKMSFTMDMARVSHQNNVTILHFFADVVRNIISPSKYNVNNNECK